MTKWKFVIFVVILFMVAFGGVSLLLYAANPTPAPLNDPNYNYSTPNSCTVCHFLMGPGGDHMTEAVGVKFDDTSGAFKFTGSGWFASRHSRSNYGSTQNTFCAKCHSPLQATPQAAFDDGFFANTQRIPDGQMEGVTCKGCHPPHGTSPRLGIYKYGQPTNQAESYTLISEDQQDLLCLNCHVERHNEGNAAFKRMYDAGVQCTDCHMARYGYVVNSKVVKRFHDFKVAQNLPYSCGAKGSLSGFSCHSEFSANSARALIPYLKEQHKAWWPLASGTDKVASIKLQTAHDYYQLWQQLERQVGNDPAPVPTPLPAGGLFGNEKK